jgi:hypothetical protein
MFTASTIRSRRLLVASAFAAVTAVTLLAAGGQAVQTVDAPVPGPAAPENAAVRTQQPPAKLVVDPPKPELLTRGVAVIQFRTENVQIVPVFGPAAAAVSPRLGHLHVTLDDAPWHWGHTSYDPIIVVPLPPGPHSILIELADADHEVLAKELVKFDVPRR